MRRNLFDILIFAENHLDSLHDSIALTFGNDDRKSTERIENMAAIIYGWVLRADQSWWQHPRWHIHHWRLQLNLWQDFKRGFSADQPKQVAESRPS